MIDATRHRPVFSPEAFGDRAVHVIGCGATGSRIAMGLAKLGIQNLILHDFDVVEGHNLANQLFGLADVGKPKVAALADIIARDTGTVVSYHADAVTGDETLGSIVFLLTDTMSSRKAIWDGCLKYKPYTDLMIETRMGVDSGRIYAVNPCDAGQIAKWEATLCGDDVAEVSACGTSITIGATADVVAGLAIWRLLSFFQYHNSGNIDHNPEFETVIGLRPTFSFSRAA